MKPLLSGKLTDKTKLKFPYLASPKLDGIRCVIINGEALSRTLKPIPNKHIQSILGDPALDGLDGEIICGNPTDEDCFRNTTTVVMSHDKIEDFTFWVFDDFSDPSDRFADRLEDAKLRITYSRSPNVTPVPHQLVGTKEELARYEDVCTSKGYEGIMLRDPDGIYKYGRSTDKEQILLKVKRYEDSEAFVIGFEEQMHNDNIKTTNHLGLSARATRKANLHPTGTLGALIVQDVTSGVRFNIGTGFDDAERQHIWGNQAATLTRTLTYTFFPVGVKDKPRHPVFKGWRTLGF